MSRPKPNLTPAQRKAYDVRMRQLRQQQQRRRRVTPKVGILGGRITAEQRRKLLAQQKANQMRLDQQRKAGKKITRSKPVAMTPQQRRRALKDAKMLYRKAQRLRNNQIAKKLGLPKAPPRPQRVRQVAPSVAAQRLRAARARGRG